MNTLVLKETGLRVFKNLPEIWYIILLSISTYKMVSFLIAKGGEGNNITFTLSAIFPILIGILIKQLFSKNKWISRLTGFIFSVISSYMLIAFLHEYREIANTLELMITGILIGISLLLGFKMWNASLLIKQYLSANYTTKTSAGKSITKE
ncbi:hypothetical protein H8788_04000 [Parabacteroides faecis]|uniref:hypothetical protein n=1 Tax=Parabacteroides TaxID=375288 RepID=UPI000EFF4B2A|nr:MULTISPECIES: hypothetical protein [Parabacteroides]MBC8616892.1 hypothetical protein [Parabacteroides faecis]RHR94420.1 hypothetical protein DWW23_19660 [Parabacteroides sp. AF14-59]